MADPLLALIPPLDIDRVRLGDAGATADALQTLWQALNDFLQKKAASGRVGAVQDATITPDMFTSFDGGTTVFDTTNGDPDASSLSVIPLGERAVLITGSIAGVLTTDNPTLTRLNMVLPFGMRGAFTTGRQFFQLAMIRNNLTQYLAEVRLVWNSDSLTIETANGEFLIDGLLVLQFQVIVTVER